MAKANPKPVEMTSVTTFCVGVRTINAGEVFPADDELVLARPEQFKPVPADDEG